MNDKIGIGIIGTGFARRVQIPAFLAAGARIASVASGRAENAEATARECGAPHFTADWRATVARADVDLVCITTPPDTHFEIARGALAAGKNVLCEKPMAMSVAEARALEELAAASGRLALIDHELRFLDGRRRAYELLRAGAIGRVRGARASFRAPHRGDANAPWNWWSDKASGGGALGAIGSHLIDSFQWFLGADIERVFCQLQTHIKERPDAATGAPRAVTTDDEANLVVRFADGPLTADATGTIAVSMTEYPEYRNRLEFFGTAGALRIEARGELFIGRPGANEWEEIAVDLGKNVDGVGDTGFARGFMAFAPPLVAAVAAGRTAIEHAATFADGVRVQKVIDAAHESNARGAAVAL